MSNKNQSSQYAAKISRRDSLKWLGMLTAGTAITVNSGYVNALTSATSNTKGHWPTLTLEPINAKGYGKDPNLIVPPSSPWPLILTVSELALVATVADIVVPREGNVPSASEVDVPSVINEWVSAPYERQQNDRHAIAHLLVWLNDEAKLRHKLAFIKLSPEQQLTIIDEIAFTPEKLDSAFTRPAEAFSVFRQLVLAAFFCSPAGMKDIGYLGNVAIAGDYPGPTKEAQAHLNNVLSELGLSQFAYKV